MSILITGGSGYFGSEIVKKLYNREKVSINLITRRYLPDYPRSVQVVGDLNESDGYKKIKDRVFDLVIHCAGYVPENAKEDIWKTCFKGNVTTTKSLVKNIRCKKFIYISTCEVYGLQKGVDKIAEGCIPNPISNYAKSKLLAEKKCFELCTKKNIKLCILRFTTIFGPGDKINRAIPNFIKSALANREIEVVGDGQNIRDYLFIEDAADAVVLAALNFKGGIYNVSSGEGVSILSLAKTVIKVLSPELKIKFSEQTDSINKVPRRLVFDNSKFVKNFNFRQKYSLRVALKMTAKLAYVIFGQYPRLQSGVKNEKRIPKEDTPLVATGGLKPPVAKPRFIFDLDGTLIDVSDRWYGLHLDLAKVYGYKPLPKKEYITLKRSGISEEEIIGRTDILPVKIGDCIKKRIELIETGEYLRKDKLKLGVDELLKRLSGLYRLVLISKRKNEKNYREEVERLGISAYFDRILIAGTQLKAQVIQQDFARDFYKDAVLVGDAVDDLIAARELGIKCWLVCDGVRDREQLSRLKPDRIFDKVTQIEWER